MDKIVLGAIPVVISGGKVLLMKRAKFPYIGYWSLPGGKMEFGEHPEQTSLRELKEETGIDGKLVAVKGVISEIVKDRKTGGKIAHFVMFICEINPLHTNLKSSAEGELRWFSIEELGNEEKITPSDVPIIKNIAIEGKGIAVHKSHMSVEGREYYLEEFSK